MKVVLTLTEMSPTETGDAVTTKQIVCNEMLEALQIVEEAAINFTVFINVSITPVRVLNSKQFPNA